MNYSDKLILAYFKSAQFFVRKEQLSNYGQKRIDHNYPQSSIRYSESQGVNPDSFVLDIFFYGDAYLDDFERFKKVCQDSQSGLLFLPTFGIYEDMVAKLASADIVHTNLGEITTTVEFTKTTEKPSPISAIPSSQTVASGAAIAASGIGGAF